MTNPISIKLITLDLDDTLWPVLPTLYHAENVLSTWLQEHAPSTAKLLTPAVRQEIRIELAQKHPEHAHDMSWLRHRALWLGMQRAGDDVELAAPAFDAFLTGRQQVSLYDDVIPVLSDWATRYTLIAITNGNADIHRTGLGHLFSAQLRAHEVGAAKPDPAIFLPACEQAGVDPAQTLHLGDDWSRDYKGAKKVGMHAALIKRPELKGSPSPEPSDGTEPDDQALIFGDLHDADRWLNTL